PSCGRSSTGSRLPIPARPRAPRSPSRSWRSSRVTCPRGGRRGSIPSRRSGTNEAAPDRGRSRSLSASAAAPVVVCGLGQVGYRTCDLLLRLGETVVVVAQDAREERRRGVLDRGARLIVADARDEARLAEAGVREAKALLALTNHDLVNVEIALDAKRLRPDLPVVVRLFDQQLARHLERSFDLRRALGVSAVAAPTFAAAALGERWIGSLGWAAGPLVIWRPRAA